MNRKIQITSILILTMLLLSSCGVLPSLPIASSMTAEESKEAPAQTAEDVTSQEAINPASNTASDLEASEILSALETAYGEIYTKVIPSVVNVSVVQTVSTQSFQLPDLPDLPFLPNTPFGEEEQPQERKSSSLGSGFVWDMDGHIVTNNHVVENADTITVTFYDGSSVKAELVGTDPDSDLAVIKVDVAKEKLQPVQVADSTKVEVGDIAIAIGNPFGLEGSMTTGIVSALGRSLNLGSGSTSLNGSSYTIPDVIQTDAAINPGNSGGVLVDKNGNLIGVTTAIQSTAGSNAGVGFVVPSIIVQNVVPVLIEDGFYQHPRIGFSGTTLTSDLAQAMDLGPDQRGALVIDITPNSPAEEAGLQGSDRQVKIDDVEYRVGGDVIIQIDNQPVNDFEDIVAYLARYTDVGQTIELTVLRYGSTETLEVTLAAREQPAATEQPAQEPDQASTAWLGILGATVNDAIVEAMELEEDQTGVLIQQVVQGSPADRARLNGSYKSATVDGQEIKVGGDIITALNGENIKDMNTLKNALQSFEPGDEIELTLLRDGEEITVPVTLEKMP